jgi:hypothetical protein
MVMIKNIKKEITMKDTKKNKTLIEYAIDYYVSELWDNFYDSDLKIRKETNFEKKQILTNALINVAIPKIVGIDEIQPLIDGTKGNPMNFEILTCYKLLLCSRLLNTQWIIPYPSLYKYFYECTKLDNNLSVDLFLGKLVKYFETYTDKEFELFQNKIIQKYKKLKLDEI